MSEKIGICIDEKTAVLVFATRKGRERHQINSRVKEHEALADDIDWNDTYYNEVAAAVTGAELIFLSGADIAVQNLEARLVRSQFNGRIVNMEPVNRPARKKHGIFLRAITISPPS